MESFKQQFVTLQIQQVIWRLQRLEVLKHVSCLIILFFLAIPLIIL